MRLAVWGTGHLAEATRENCARFWPLVASRTCDTLWFCTDTPVEGDRPDVAALLEELDEALGFAPDATLIVISSQLPVGTCRQIEERWPRRRFAVQPENIRRATAKQDFARQRRMVVGTRRWRDRQRMRSLLRPFTDTVLFMSPESAEMTKHTLNTFLALNIAFVNEIADTCQKVGADVDDVMAGFRSDVRVGDGPLTPGPGFNGGTLGRDVYVLEGHAKLGVIRAIRPSNERHL